MLWKKDWLNSNMKSSFIVTSSKQNYKPFRNQPLGELYLSTILEQHFKDQLDVSMIDLRSINPDDAIYHVPERDVYMYSVTTLDYLDTKRIVGEIRQIYPNAKHIAGGPHIEALPEESSKIFDAISLGKGEESIKRMIEDISNSRLKNLYKQEGNIDFSSYPYASRKFLPKSAIAQSGILNGENRDLNGTSVLFSRGCPFQCYFCANQNKGKTIFTPFEVMAEEIAYLKREYGVEALAIKDDNGIPVNKKIAKPYLETIAKAGVKWRGQSRANGISRDFVKLAKESGCVEIAVGIESVSEKVLKNINKKIELEPAKKYLKMLKEEGIDRRLLLITGLPGEPKDIADRTIEFIKETEPSSVLFSILCPLPGTEMYRNPKRFGMKIDYNVPFDCYIPSVGRFDENEKPRQIFEYEEVTPFGKGMSMEEIFKNHAKVQDFLRKNNLIF